jgi:hypothetical protein
VSERVLVMHPIVHHLEGFCDECALRDPFRVCRLAGEFLQTLSDWR